MRRTITLLIAFALMVYACGGGSAAEDEMPDVLDQWTEAVMAGDAAAIAALYTEDGVWHDHARARIFEGRPAIESGLEGALLYLTLTEMELLSLERNGDTIVTEWRWSGTSSTHARPSDDQTPFETDVDFTFVLDGDAIASSDFTYEYASLFN